MSELTSVLNELVADAPVEKANWPDVVARSRRLRRRRVPRRLVLALAALALLALAGTAIGVGMSLLTNRSVSTLRFRMTQSASVPWSRSRLVKTGRSSAGEARTGSALTSRSQATPHSAAAFPSAARSRQRMPPAAVSPRTQSRDFSAEAISWAAMAGPRSLVSLRTRWPQSRSSFATAELSMRPSMTRRPRWRPRFGSSFACLSVS